MKYNCICDIIELGSVWNELEFIITNKSNNSMDNIFLMTIFVRFFPS